MSCDQGASFFDLARSINAEILRVHPNLLGNLKVEAKLNVGLFSLSGTNAGQSPATATTVHEVCDMLRVLTKGLDECVVILDEFDQIGGNKDKKYFADLIKQLSDRNLPIRLVITGIGRSLEELIGVHLSTDRYIAPIMLEPISHDARWQILQRAMETFGLVLDENQRIRIGQISDGFPYYVHLIGEKILWAAFDSPTLVTKIGDEIYSEGLHQAIEATSVSLKGAYDLATMKHKHSENYEQALWAVADGPMLMKQVSDIYSVSYLRICRALKKEEPLPKEKFYQLLNKLKKPPHGSVLHANKQGWYEFSENILRGYVRLRAERAGVPIGVDLVTGV